MKPITKKNKNLMLDALNNVPKLIFAPLAFQAVAKTIDLKENINLTKNISQLKKCKLIPINILNNKSAYPKIKKSTVLLSQFLDCFKKDNIDKIKDIITKARLSITQIYNALSNYTLLECSKS